MSAELDDDDEGRSTHWKLNKEIPLSLMIMLLLQTVTLVWWIATTNATINARLNNLEERRIEANAATQQFQAAIGALPERVLRMEIQQSYVVTSTQQLSSDVKNLQTALERLHK
ncbi:MAG TPA: hypothetical protein VGC12_00345 [Methyloradius sp.]